MTFKKIYLTYRWDPNGYSTAPSQDKYGKNYNEGVFHNPYIFRTGTSPSDAV